MEEGQINCLLRQILQNLLDILWALLPNYFVALCKILATPLRKQPRTVCNVSIVVILYVQYNSM